MFVMSHYLIGNFIYKSLLKEYSNASLNIQLLFEFGNVLPDLHPKLSQTNHYLECTYADLEKYVKQSQDQNLSSNQRILSLGIVCHFLSDYFCTYHAFPYYKKQSIIKHLFYELKLHIQLTYLLLFQRKNLIECADYTFDSYTDIHTMIAALQQDYFNGKTSIMTDIIFALRASYITASTLLGHPLNCFEEESHVLWWPLAASERAFLP